MGDKQGVKYDKGKPLAGVLEDFSLALLAVAEVGTFGAEKYSRGNWQRLENGVERYTDAMWRHLLAMRHEIVDEETGFLHDQQMVWNALARLELRLRQEREASRESADGVLNAKPRGGAAPYSLNCLEQSTAHSTLCDCPVGAGKPDEIAPEGYAEVLPSILRDIVAAFTVTDPDTEPVPDDDTGLPPGADRAAGHTLGTVTI